jgi:hypothetical protein
LIVTVLDISDQPYLEPVEHDGAGLDQSVNLGVVDVIIIGRLEQVNTFQVVHAPEKNNQGSNDR